MYLCPGRAPETEILDEAAEDTTLQKKGFLQYDHGTTPDNA